MDEVAKCVYVCACKILCDDEDVISAMGYRWSL